MNRNYILPFTLLFLSLAQLACSENKPTKTQEQPTSHPPLFSSLIGSWQTIGLKATYHALTDTPYVVQTPPESYEQEFNMKPIVTYYYENGTYLMEYRTTGDSVFSKIGGTWSTREDTLIMNHGGVPKTVYKYGVQLKGDTAVFEGWADLDKDGIVDDLYQGTQLKNQ